MDTINQVIEDIIVEFDKLAGVEEKYAYLFKLGKQLPQMDDTLKNKETRVKGCQSTLWFSLTKDEDRFYLMADSDSLVIKGIAALLARIIAGRRAEEIKQLSMDFVDKLQIWKLASERNNGLMSMLRDIKDRVSGS